jgi:ABC-type multidrug transport system fused ATPase/permease subunit
MTTFKRMQKLAGIKEFEEFNADDFEDLESDFDSLKKMGFQDDIIKVKYGEDFLNLARKDFGLMAFGEIKKNNLFFSNYTSGHLTQNVIGESQFTKDVMISFVTLLTEVLIIIFMFFLIFSQKPTLGVLTIIFIITASVIYYFFMKKKN